MFSCSLQHCGAFTSYIPARNRAATAENDEFMYIHGGIDLSGQLLGDLFIVDKAALNHTHAAVTGTVPSPRYCMCIRVQLCVYSHRFA